MEAENLIPDFDDFETLAREAAELKGNLIVIKSHLAKLEAECMRVALTDNTYWIGGKRPSMAYCEKVVKLIGNTPEDKLKLSNLRQELADLTEASQLLQHLITMERDKLDLYRTFSANTRKGFLDG